MYNAHAISSLKDTLLFSSLFLQAFSSFYYTTNYFASNVTTVKKAQGWVSIREAVMKNCSLPRNGATDNCIVNGKVHKSCYQSCFDGLFMLYLLEYGFGFNNDTNARDWSVEFQNQVREGLMICACCVMQVYMCT